MTLDTVETYLQQYGWQYQRHDDGVMTGFEGESALFAILIQHEAPWLRISVPAYTPPLPQEGISDLLYKLLEINFSERMVRFAINEHRSLTLCIDLYAEPDLTYSQFETALDVTSYAAETAHPHIMALLN